MVVINGTRGGSMKYRFKGLPTKTVEGHEFPDTEKYADLGLDERVATVAHPTDIGQMPEEEARLVAGTEVEVREVVPAGEVGAGPIGEEMIVVHWNPTPNPDYDPDVEGSTEIAYLRAMSFTKDQFNALFEEVK